MTSYEEYTLYLVGVPALIMSKIILYKLGIDRGSIKGAFLYLALFILHCLMFAAFVFFIRYIRM